MGGDSRFDFQKFLLVEESVKIQIISLTLSSRNALAKYSLLKIFHRRKSWIWEATLDLTFRNFC
ncbi:hypothetical protein, partial [Dapis sp. BLCC M229]|uniref:hypothetical protein n=1 Tax=Dapis sp. BLCC M229 TaxID=3400188 RepID=UPI003CFAB2CD